LLQGPDEKLGLAGLIFGCISDLGSQKLGFWADDYASNTQRVIAQWAAVSNKKIASIDRYKTWQSEHKSL